MKYGVPQGSKLGPILVIIYINKVVEIFKRLGIDCKLFADDMMVSVCGNNLCDIERKLNCGLKVLSEWLKDNQFKINVKKTVYMVVHDRRFSNVRDKCKILVNNNQLSYVRETKYLGVIIDDNLSF